MKIKSLALGVAGAIALGSSAFADRGSDGNVGIISVSYTHLTLPTTLVV